MQNEMRFDPPTHPERSQEAHYEGPGGSSVVQEIVAETQAERNNRENESYFREQPAEQNSSPVDCCATHSPRSEERRVGKECRSSMWACPEDDKYILV